jgi:hypothetical protein
LLIRSSFWSLSGVVPVTDLKDSRKDDALIPATPFRDPVFAVTKRYSFNQMNLPVTLMR